MDFWSQIQHLEGQALRTLAQQKPFEIAAVTDTQVLLQVSTGKVRKLRRIELESAWHELALRGELSRSEIRARHSWGNPAYVAAILAKLDGVTHRIKPIRLLYSSG